MNLNLTLNRAKQQRDFEQFLSAVDSELIKLVGLKHRQCASFPWFQSFKDGRTVRATISDFIVDKDFQ